MLRKGPIRFVLPALLVLAASQARADLTWTEDWSGSNQFLTTGSSTITITGQPLTTVSSTSAIPSPSGNVASITFTSTADGHTPDVFNSSTGAYTLSMTVTDGPSSLSHTFTFTGYLSGPVSGGQSGANLMNNFTSPTTETFTFADGDKYTVTINSIIPPRFNFNNSKGFTGAVYASVTGLSNGGSGSPNNTPEPCTLALAGLGSVFAGLAAWRKRRLQVA
jgi:hypothetical protein